MEQLLEDHKEFRIYEFLDFIGLYGKEFLIS